MGTKKNGRSRNTVTWAQAVRDIVITSMNRGQLPIVGLIFLAIFIVWKMPNEEVAKLAFSILAYLVNGELWAYVLLIVIVIGWYTHARIMRKAFSEESARIGREKSALQSGAAKENFKSSET